MLAGIGAVALAGAFVAPGVAAAAPSSSLGSLGSSPEATEAEVVETETITYEGKFDLTATGYDNCTVTFELTNLWEDYPGTAGGPNWRTDYQVDDESPSIERDIRDVYRPVLTNSQATKNAIDARENPYEIALGETTVDLTAERTVPLSNDDVTTVPGVESNADGEHTVTFGVYQGPGLGNALDEYNDTKSVTVTGCPTADDATGSLGSLDLFGSLGSLFGTEK